MRGFRFLLPVLSLLACPAIGAEEENTERWEITIECQMVTVPQKIVLTLVPELMDETTIEAGWAKLQALIERGEATLEANLIARTSSETSGAAETIKEVRYPLEFYPAGSPSKAANNGAEDLETPPLIAFTPSSFATRNVGARMQLDFVMRIGSGDIGVEAVVEHTRLLDWKKVELGSLGNGRGIFIEQPQFAVARSHGTVTLRNGQRMLFGMHKLAEPADTFELFLLKASMKRAP